MAERTGIFSGDDPIALARAWLAEAEAKEINDPNAMALATVDASGLPNVRMVLLKDIEDRGFVFYTNFESRKGEELGRNGKAALVLHWKSLRRQLRVRGPVERVDDAVADAYFVSRSLQSRLGAWASRQSRHLDSRATLMAEVARQTARHGIAPPRPPFWGGYRVLPQEIEFWADGAFRLHDRFRWERDLGETGWRVTRLNP